MWRSCASGLLCLGLFACETAPPPPVELTQAELDAAIAEAEGKWHPWVSIDTLTETLETATVSDTQQARLLFARGAMRREARINLPGAIEDYDRSLTLAPEAPFAANAQTERGYAETALQEVRARLSGPRLQTLPQWFDDKIANGELEAAVKRFRESGLAPEPEDARLLEAAGYLCSADGSNGDWDLGQDVGHLEDLEWCENPAVS